MAAIAAACLIAVLRWLLLAGLAGALGGVAGRGLARQYRGEAPAPLPAPWALRCSLLGLAAAAALTALTAGGRALAGLRLHSAVGPLLATGQARITAVECAAFGLAAVALRLRRPGLSTVPLLAVALAEATRAHPEGIVPVGGALLSLTHLLPAVLWAGMLCYTLRAAIAWRNHPAAMRGLILLYANTAVWLFAVVVITGVVSALVLVPLGSLLSTGYGIILLVKAALVLVVAVLATAGRRWLGHEPARGAGPARATRWECYALAGVLAVTAVLTVLTPPAAPARATAARAVPAARPTSRRPRPGRPGHAPPDGTAARRLSPRGAPGRPAPPGHPAARRLSPRGAPGRPAPPGHPAARRLSPRGAPGRPAPRAVPRALPAQAGRPQPWCPAGAYPATG